MASITFVSSSIVTYGSRSTTTVPMPTGVVAGDEIRIFLDIGLALATPVDFTTTDASLVATITYANSDPWAQRESEYRYRVKGSGDPTAFTFTHPTAYTGAVAAAYSGVDATTPDDATSTTATGSGYGPTSAKFAGLTVVTAGAVLIGARGSWDGNPITPPAGWTVLVDQVVTWAGYKPGMTAGATGDITLNSGNAGSTPWGTILSVLRPAAVATPTGSISSVTVSGSTATVSGSTSGAPTIRWGESSSIRIDPDTAAGQQPNGWTGVTLPLIASEEFNGIISVTDAVNGLITFRPNGSEWATWYPNWPMFSDPGGNHTNTGSASYYTTGKVGVTAGSLTLACDLQTTYTGLPYTAGMISSKDVLEPTYGFYAEAKIRLDATYNGLWPAWWSSAALYNAWPPEIDFWEHFGDGTTNSYFTNVYDTAKTTWPEYNVSNALTDITAWHTYGCYWQPGVGTTFYRDGVQTGTTTNAPADGALYFMLNNGAQASKSPNFAASTLFADYIRVWALPGTADVTNNAWGATSLPTSHRYAASGIYTIDLASDGTLVASTTITIGSSLVSWDGTAWKVTELTTWDGTVVHKTTDSRWNGSSWV